MKIMIVEFKTVRSNIEESHEKEIASVVTGMTAVPFHNEKDYIASVAIEMDDVTGFTGGRVYFNDQMLECVYCDFGEGLGSTNLLIDYDGFKEVFYKATDNVVYTADQIKAM